MRREDGGWIGAAHVQNRVYGHLEGGQSARGDQRSRWNAAKTDGGRAGAPIVASWRFEKERSLAANEALS